MCHLLTFWWWLESEKSRAREKKKPQIPHLRAKVIRLITRATSFIHSPNNQIPIFFLIQVELKIMLPNQSCLTINIKRNQQTSEVIDIVLQKLQIPTKLTRHFGIFETVENNFGKILVSILKKRQISVIDAIFFFWI